MCIKILLEYASSPILYIDKSFPRLEKVINGTDFRTRVRYYLSILLLCKHVPQFLRYLRWPGELNAPRHHIKEKLRGLKNAVFGHNDRYSSWACRIGCEQCTAFKAFNPFPSKLSSIRDLKTWDAPTDEAASTLRMDRERQLAVNGDFQGMCRGAYWSWENVSMIKLTLWGPIIMVSRAFVSVLSGFFFQERAPSRKNTHSTTRKLQKALHTPIGINNIICKGHHQKLRPFT